MLKIKPIT